ncbi:MAG: flagellar biosynthesis protein FliA [Desulfotomaculum sp.]|nr:flagellar biosynthesis protein FliA [Desulfotomaculum sp.]
MPAGLWEMAIVSLINGILLLVSFISAYSHPSSTSKCELKKYLAEIKKGDEDSLYKLVDRNLNLITGAVKNYQKDGLDEGELIFLGTIGLIKAVRTYNEEYDISFPRYASIIIEQELNQSIKVQ